MGLRIETMNVIKTEVILWDYHPNWAAFVEIENSKEKRFLTHLSPFRSVHGIESTLKTLFHRS